MTIGEFIKRRRVELGLTLEEVGNFTGVGKSTVRKWELGFITNMGRDKIASLSKILKVSPLVLLNETIEDYEAAKNYSRINDNSAASNARQQLVDFVYSIPEEDLPHIQSILENLVRLSKNQ